MTAGPSQAGGFSALLAVRVFLCYSLMYETGSIAAKEQAAHQKGSKNI